MKLEENSRWSGAARQIDKAGLIVFTDYRGLNVEDDRFAQSAAHSHAVYPVVYHDGVPENPVTRTSPIS